MLKRKIFLIKLVFLYGSIVDKTIFEIKTEEFFGNRRKNVH